MTAVITYATARLRRRRDDLTATIGSIISLAASENRPVTDEEWREWDQAIEQLDHVNARLAGALATEARKTEVPRPGSSFPFTPAGGPLT